MLGQPGIDEVLVIDGGSEDATVEIASRYVRVLNGTRGRARQMNAGAIAASGDVFVFLHADTRLPDDAVEVITRALSDPEVAGGCFRTTFDDDSIWMRIWSWRLWMRWHRLAFGDRAPFIRRHVFEEIGGFPDQPMFEDLDLVRKLRKEGRFVLLDEPVETSARRFHRHGAFRQQITNTALWIGWVLGLSSHRLKRFYSDEPDERGVDSTWAVDPDAAILR